MSASPHTGFEHVDVLIVGAGLSGVGAGCHLQRNCPNRSYAILEARASIGGTWDLFRYPGIRSDSDMYTLGYSFKPWRDARSIVDGQSILSYVRETAGEHGVDSKVRFHHRVVRAEWSSPEARWTVEVLRTDAGESTRMTCSFLLMCSGYYRYDEGYTPELAGIERFAGPVVHPQHWPEDLDYAGKRVVVIGSGATAVTLVPAMSERAAHVTMLQRSPSYVISLPGEDSIARALRRLLPSRATYAVVRWKNVLMTLLVFQLSRRRPALVKRLIRGALERNLPPGYDIDTHFKPSYDPWDQRMCLVPDGDLFEAIAGGRVSIVTDHIDRFTEKGVRLTSGKEIEAEVVVTATGLNMLVFGGVQMSVDGREVDPSQSVSYKGMMLEGVPNMAWAFGYTNASWTLKADLTCEYVCRLLNHMAEHEYAECRPLNGDPAMPTEPFIDFSSGYVLRAIDKFPRQGTRIPWRVHQNYALDILSLRFGELDDGALQFSRAPAASAVGEPIAA